MWRKIPPPSKDDETVLRMSKRMKLYADEDIEDDVVEFFRDQGVNVKGARELGHRGKPDSLPCCPRIPREALSRNPQRQALLE
jgi:hypothetical protein